MVLRLLELRPSVFERELFILGGSDCDDEFIRFTMMSKTILWRNYGPFFELWPMENPGLCDKRRTDKFPSVKLT